MSEVIGTLAALTVFVGITFGTLAAFPRTRRAMIIATPVLLAVFSLLSALGSGLLGLVDMRPMFLFTPLIVASVAGWYFLKIKPRETQGG